MNYYNMHRLSFINAVVCILLMNCHFCYAEPRVIERSATVANLLPDQSPENLAKIIDPSTQIHFKIQLPSNSIASNPAFSNTSSAGILVFVKPDNSSDLPNEWSQVLDQHNIIWIAAEGFGNDRPSKQRVLVALMALNLVEREFNYNPQRIYIGGTSGGGRVASTVMTYFPQRFSGALYIVGADDWNLNKNPQALHIVHKRFAFVTGTKDFNREEMKQVFARYKKYGVTQLKLFDAKNFGHEYPRADFFDEILKFLDPMELDN